jgi:hypothetical protein
MASHMRSNLDLLISQANELGVELTRLEATLSPTCQVPEEILSEIFLCLPSYCFPRRRDIKKIQNIRLVSKLWNQVAMDTSALWCHFELCTDLWKPPRSQDRQRFIVAMESAADSWLERSKLSPLSIRIRDLGKSGSFSRNFLCDQLSKVDIRIRIRRLHLSDIADEEEVEHLLQECQEHSLEEFIYDGRTDGALGTFRGKYSKLTRLRLTRIPTGAYQDFLSKGLKSLAITLSAPRISVDGVLPYIKKSIEGIPGRYPLLAELSLLPGLDSLIFVGGGQHVFKPVVQAIANLHVLRKLCIGDAFLSQMCIDGTLISPTVEKLTFLAGGTQHDFAELRKEHTAQGILKAFPRLGILELSLDNDAPLGPCESSIAITIGLLNADAKNNCLKDSAIGVIRYTARAREDLLREAVVDVTCLSKRKRASTSGPKFRFGWMDDEEWSSVEGSREILAVDWLYFVGYYRVAWEKDRALSMSSDEDEPEESEEEVDEEDSDLDW